MRFLLLLLLLPAAGYVVWTQFRPSLPPLPSLRSLTSPTPPAKTAREIKDCRDQCEQRLIVAGSGGDEELRACRARCEGSATTARPHEVPSRITVAPAVSRPHVYTQPAQLPLRAAEPRHEAR